jgi:hypothetical protein
MSSADTSISGKVQLSRRELRLICRRLLVAHDAPPGIIPAATEAMVDGIALGLPILDPDRTDLGLPASLADHRSPDWHVDRSDLHVACHGQWAPMLAPALADIVRLAAARSDISRITVADARNGAALEAARGRLSRAGYVLTPSRPDATWSLSRGADLDFRDAEHRLVLDGITFTRESWLTLYRASLRGLTPESEESFRHAGYIDEHGDPIEGMDDDHDIEAALSSFVPSLPV